MAKPIGARELKTRLGTSTMRPGYVLHVPHFNGTIFRYEVCSCRRSVEKAVKTRPHLIAMLVLMMVVASAPDLFHHIPMQHAMASEAGSSDLDQHMPHQPLSCSLLHVGHLCHIFASITAIGASAPAITHTILPFQATSPVDDFPSQIFHPPRS